MRVVHKGNTSRRCKAGLSVQTSLRGIASKALREKEYRFVNLYGMLDEQFLITALGKLNKRATGGLDGVTVSGYQENLEENLKGLAQRLKDGRYRAKLVKRVYIPKSNGKKRPLGLPVLEDKIVQKATAMILEAIYEQDFLACSYGYRQGRNARGAIKDLGGSLYAGPFDYVVEADIKGFFDHLDHGKLVAMLEKRINDRKLIRLIRKWLKAGILEPEGMVIHPLTGTPQGGIVSPVLANVYLHHVLDQWVEDVVRPHSRGAVKLVRYADDFVVGFQYGWDAELFYSELPKRLEAYGLSVAEEKTRIMRFGAGWGKTNGRFVFLGFELYWGKTRKGGLAVKRRTSPKKLRENLIEFNLWMKKHRSVKLWCLFKELNSKLIGYFNYYGVIGNYKGIQTFHYQATRMLFKWLNRRSHRLSYTWDGFNEMLKHYQLARPRITEKPNLQRNLPFR